MGEKVSHLDWRLGLEGTVLLTVWAPPQLVIGYCHWEHFKLTKMLLASLWSAFRATQSCKAPPCSCSGDMKKAAARVCFHISDSCALKRGMLEGSCCRITHLQGTAQACNPCPGRNPIDGFQFFCEAAAFVFRGEAGFWTQVESKTCQLWAGPWHFVCALAAVFVVGGRYFSWWRTEHTQFTLDCFHRIHAFPRACLSVSGVQWVKPWSLIHNQFVLLSVPSGKVFWNVPAPEYSLVLIWRSKTSCLRTNTSSCPPI